MDYSNSAGWPVDDLFSEEPHSYGFGSAGIPAFMAADIVIDEISSQHFARGKRLKHHRPNPRRQRRMKKRDRRRTKR